MNHVTDVVTNNKWQKAAQSIRQSDVPSNTKCLLSSSTLSWFLWYLYNCAPIRLKEESRTMYPLHRWVGRALKSKWCTNSWLLYLVCWTCCISEPLVPSVECGLVLCMFSCSRNDTVFQSLLNSCSRIVVFSFSSQ